MIAAANSGRNKLDQKKYARLLARALPRVIRSEKENERVLAAVWELIKKGETRLSPEELELLEVLSTLIEKFEEERYPIPEARPHDVLTSLMDERGLRQKDLLGVLGSSGTVSEVVRGKRSISKAQVKKLAAFFHVPADVFI
ncbi:MAG: helix-turn-helix domain-containing protein [Blastocatellia bacterium]